MDNNILKKRLNTFKTDKGSLKNVSNEVVLEVLAAWENWPGTAAELYRELSLSKMQLVTMIQKAKRLVKGGAVPPSDFKEIKVDTNSTGEGGCCIEIAWDGGKVIRFGQVDHLIDFLKKVA
jgi:hypothetical protein